MFVVVFAGMINLNDCETEVVNFNVLHFGFSNLLGKVKFITHS